MKEAFFDSSKTSPCKTFKKLNYPQIGIIIKKHDELLKIRNE